MKEDRIMESCQRSRGIFTSPTDVQPDEMGGYTDNDMIGMKLPGQGTDLPEWTTGELSLRYGYISFL
ncbi:MAG: hypothetical protein IPL16_18690 [Ignavibacteria bacterium]|nr:hypothetical protein [Ignavibacteria bacterium]